MRTHACTHTQTISLGDHRFVFSIPHSQVYTCMSCTWVILFSFSLSRPLSYSHCHPSHERPSYLTCFVVSRPVCDPLSLIRIARISTGGSYLLECRWLYHEEKMIKVGVLVRVNIAMLKHHDHKQLWEQNVYLSYVFRVTVFFREPRQELKSGRR